jgi:hypothetical protein
MTEYYVYFQPKFRPIADSQTTYQPQLLNKKKATKETDKIAYEKATTTNGNFYKYNPLAETLKHTQTTQKLTHQFSLKNKILQQLSVAHLKNKPQNQLIQIYRRPILRLII